MTCPVAALQELPREDPSVIESARDQLAFLAEASALLGASLDYEVTLQNAARLAVPTLADLCVIDVVEDDGSLRRVAIAAVDPATEAVMREMTGRYAPDPRGVALLQVLRIGEPWVLPEVPDAFWAQAAQDGEHEALIRRLGVRSVAVLPLVARARAIGTITLVMLGSGRTYQRSALGVAEELARRAAVAVDNARLHREVQEAKERASRQAARLQAVAEASQAFAEASLELDAVLQVIVRRIVELIGDVCIIRLPSDDGRWLDPVALYHPDPEALELLRDMQRASPQRADEGLGGRVLQTGEPVLMPVVDVEEFRRGLKPEYSLHLDRFPVYSLLIVPLRVLGRVTGVLAVSREKPGRSYEVEDQLRLQELADRAALAIENARLYRQAQAARLEAEAANRAKDDFLATLSHELRTPLSAILAWAQLLRMSTADDRTRVRGLEAIERNTRMQAQLIDDLLDVSRITSGKLRLETVSVDLCAVTEAAVEVVAQSAEAKGIRLTRTLDAGTGAVAGDPARLQQVVWNLLSNAVKFTPRGGRIAVRLERADGQARLTVADSGKGIAPDLLPHVFERFRQGDSTTTRVYGGLGLGLAIVRRLVELHGGTVSAESAGEGRGATFTVTLPVAPAVAAQAEPLGPVPGTRLEGVHVLVVDDHADCREVLAAAFATSGARVTAAASVASALAALERECPDVLVSDIAMPGEDGYTLIRRVRSLERQRGARLPAIALTAYAGADARARALASGYDLHLAKPVQPIELLAVVAGLLEGEAAHGRSAGRTG